MSGRVPEFAGLYLDSDGTPVVVLTDPAKEGSARSVLTPVLAERGGRAIPSLRFATGKYAWSQMRPWRERARELFRISGVTSLGYRDRLNRLVVGVNSNVLRSEVWNALRALEIDTAAVVVERRDPVIPLSTLHDYVRPIEGSLRIGPHHDSTSWCSAGFTAKLNNTSVLITASHCSIAHAELDSTGFYQPHQYQQANFIGYEYADPEPFTGGNCPSGNICRYSEGMAVALAGGVSFLWTSFARTTANNGSTTISSSIPHFVIYNTAVSAWEGTTLDKIGARTGWTTGDVDQTCEDFDMPRTGGGSILLLCQYRVETTVGPGDSGGPVFYRIPYFGTNVTLYGIAFAGQTCSGNPPTCQYLWYSPTGQLSTDLGQLVIFGNDGPGGGAFELSVAGPTTVGPNNHTCGIWQANVTGGTSPYSYDWSGLFTSSDQSVAGTVPTSGGYLYLSVVDANSSQASIAVQITYDPNDLSYCE